MSCIPLGVAQPTLKFHNIPARIIVDAKVDKPDVSKLLPYFLMLELEVNGQPPPPYDSVEVDIDLSINSSGTIEMNCYKRCAFGPFGCEWVCSRTYGGPTINLSFKGVKVSGGIAKAQTDLVKPVVQAARIDVSKPFYIELSTVSASAKVSVFFSGPYGRALAGSYTFDIKNFSGEVRATIGQGTQGPSNCDEGCPGSCSQCAYAKQGYTCKEIQTASGTYCCCTKPSTGTPQPGSYHAVVESYDIPPTAEPNKWYDFSIRGRVLYQGSPPPVGYVAIEYVDGPSAYIETRYPGLPGTASVSKGERDTKRETNLSATGGVIEFKGQIQFPQAGIYKLRIVAGYSQDKLSRNDRDSKDVTVSVKEPGGQPPLGTGCPSGYSCVPPLVCQDPSKQNGTCPGSSPLTSWVCCKQDTIGPRDTSPTCPQGSRETRDVFCDCTIVKDLGNGRVCCSDVVDQCSPGYECVPASQCQGTTKCKCKNCGSTECVCCKKPGCPSDAPCMPVDQCLDLGGTCTGSCTGGCCCRLPQPQPSPSQPQRPSPTLPLPSPTPTPSPTQQPQPQRCPSDTVCMPVRLCRNLGGICTGSCPDGCCCRPAERGPMPI